jgi:hypothetical protein
MGSRVCVLIRFLILFYAALSRIVWISHWSGFVNILIGVFGDWSCIFLWIILIRKRWIHRHVDNLMLLIIVVPIRWNPLLSIPIVAFPIYILIAINPIERRPYDHKWVSLFIRPRNITSTLVNNQYWEILIIVCTVCVESSKTSVWH